MDARKQWLMGAGMIACLAAFLLGLGIGSPAIKVRVTVDGSPIKATPVVIGGQILMTVPEGTVLDVEAKLGDWYKVTVTKDGMPIAGYISAMVVTEITEAEAQQALSSAGKVKSQADIAAEIEFRMEEGKRLIRQEKEPDKAINDLSPLIAKTFSIDDRQKQKQLACELYYWIGLAEAQKGDRYEALKAFRNMIDVDYAFSKETTKNISDPSISGLLDQAEQLSKGLLVEYSFQITTKPKEALLKINGKPIGLSPEVHRSTIPKLTLEISKDGFKPLKEEVFLTQATTIKDYVLESIGRNLAVSTVPKGAKVFVDGRDSGKLTDCELPFLAYGSHTVRLARENHADWEGTVQIPEGDGPVPVSAILAVNTYAFAQKNGGPESQFFKLPRAIAFDKEGSFYIADESGYRIKKFDSEAHFRSAWGDAGRETKVLKVPAGIAVDGAGNVYVTDVKACCVVKFDKNGKFLKEWGEEGAKPNELAGPTAIAVDSAGDLYVADTNNNRVVKYSSEGVLKKIWGKHGDNPGEFYLPTALTVGPQNEVLVIDRLRIQKFSPTGESLGSWGKPGTGDGEFKAPLGVCTDSFNYVYIADTGNNRILKFDPNGKLISQWGQPGTGDGQMTAPCSIAVNAQGHVFIIEKQNQRFQEFRIPEK